MLPHRTPASRIPQQADDQLAAISHAIRQLGRHLERQPDVASPGRVGRHPHLDPHCPTLTDAQQQQAARRVEDHTYRFLLQTSRCRTCIDGHLPAPDGHQPTDRRRYIQAVAALDEIGHRFQYLDDTVRQHNDLGWALALTHNLHQQLHATHTHVHPDDQPTLGELAGRLHRRCEKLLSDWLPTTFADPVWRRRNLTAQLPSRWQRLQAHLTSSRPGGSHPDDTLLMLAPAPPDVPHLAPDMTHGAADSAFSFLAGNDLQRAIDHTWWTLHAHATHRHRQRVLHLLPAPALHAAHLSEHRWVDAAPVGPRQLYQLLDGASRPDQPATWTIDPTVGDTIATTYDPTVDSPRPDPAPRTRTLRPAGLTRGQLLLRHLDATLAALR